MAVRKKKVVRMRAAPVATDVRWTPAKRDAFLAALTETANVVGAARMVGVPERSPYRLRTKDAAFAAAWDAALDEAYNKLELMLLRRATFGEACDGEATPPISTSFALALLRHHHARSRRGTADLPRPMPGAALRDQLETRIAELNRRYDAEA